MIPAIPEYLGKEFKDGKKFKDAPPGHCFGLYFAIWNERTWLLEKTRKSEALKETLSIPSESRNQIDALRSRQQALIELTSEDARLSLEAVTTSPLATGMGMEHPLENGFAFLNPYGLPYLPSSGSKGVLRRAAEELRDERKDGWTQDAITELFGLESDNRQTEHTRGALTFWDTIPEIREMGIDVMTPHYSDYYQGKSTPHDAGQPNPIVFLVIPPQSRFTFHITADLRRFNKVENWKRLMQDAFEYAFDWLGFGAKTSVGYGAMCRDLDAEAAHVRQQKEAAEREREKAEKEATLAQLDPVERSIIEFLESRPDKNQPEISAVMGAAKQGKWQGEEKKAVARWLESHMRSAKLWKPQSQAKKPEKDREHQNTLLVINWLEGKK